ncbi:hypothetical protein BN8_02959 [Fibrisoma limi BUZ 3]|uniref:DUF4440 domain-containing protein n=1 Tax=Fibrisoma limi BUZ 3 TaxID=1185876 RepID=I2GIV5_9BACT|nr:nuclear transport factor 2 family protein [Fibrisoma limi]CCH53830.1 hypothetical protein BN8_02959 [Fibrisoma limi BUZ 3]
MYKVWLAVAGLAGAVLPHEPLTVQSDYQALVAAERAFAQRAIDKGIRDAFLENLDEQSVIYETNRFIPGRPAYARLQSAPGKLLWRPAYAEIAQSGTLGYTTGPFEIRPHSMDDKPVAHGQYTTVWHKTADGSWKALVDFGIVHGKPDVPVPDVQPPARFAEKVTAIADTAALGRELLRIEKAFAEAARTKSLSEAYRQVWPATDSVRLLRDGFTPYVAKEATTLADASSQQVDYEPVRAVAASSGDYGFVYGYATYRNKKQAYLRIWRKRSGRWQLAQEVLNVKLVG